MRDDLTTANRKPISYLTGLPITGLYRRPFKSSGMDTQLVFGTGFDVSDIKGRFAWGQEVPVTGKLGYVGYVLLSSLSEGKRQSNKRIRTLCAPIFKKPDLKSQVQMLLPLNAFITAEGTVGDYIKIADLGYVHRNHCVAAKSKVGNFVDVAEQHFGLPYIWGGIGPNGLDCSGLVLSCLRAIGRPAPRDTDMQEKALGTQVEIKKNLSGLKRGDLVFWKGHVGIMTNANNLLHANAYHMSVEREPINEATRRIAKTAGPITSIKRFSWA